MAYFFRHRDVRALKSVINRRYEKMKTIVGALFILVMLSITCSENQDTLKVGTHPAEWNNPGSPEFHGKVINETGLGSCQSCHGDNFTGGESGISCYTCHSDYPHPSSFNEPLSPLFHGQYIRASLLWDVAACQSCHGDNYGGETSGVSCKSSGCHTGLAGPEACNTCHGDFSDPGHIAPPEDLNKNSSYTAIGVGAHQMHVRETTVTVPYTCSACHPPLNGFNDPNHINLNIPHAQMSFNSLATDDGRLNVVWSHDAASCANVYCHGWFEFPKADAPAEHQFAYVDGAIVGNQSTVIWTSRNDDCNFCHGLPPTGHLASTLSECAGCHSSVVDENGKIINTSLHINGEVNVF